MGTLTVSFMLSLEKFQDFFISTNQLVEGRWHATNT